MTSSAMSGAASSTLFVRRRRSLVAHALRILDAWSYTEIDVPLLSPFAALRPAIGDDVDRELFRFVDRSGELLYLRGDLTPTVAHVLARRLDPQAGPLRVSYANRIARVQRDFARQQFESYEAGFELVGEPAPASDIEALVVAADLITSLGVTTPTFVVGDVRIARALCHRAGPLAADLLKAVSVRDVAHVQALSDRAGLPTADRAALASLCRMAAQRELATALCTHADADVRHAAAHLLASTDALKEAVPGIRVSLDLSAVGRRSYYTGLQFSVVSETWGTALGAGGRYDDLFGHFGSSASAVGFGLYIDRLVRAGFGDDDATASPELALAADSFATAVAARRAGERIRMQHVRVDVDPDSRGGAP